MVRKTIQPLERVARQARQIQQRAKDAALRRGEATAATGRSFDVTQCISVALTALVQGRAAGLLPQRAIVFTIPLHFALPRLTTRKETSMALIKVKRLWTVETAD